MNWKKVIMNDKYLEELKQYKALEKRLADMFGGDLTLKMVVDELDRQIQEPNTPHPINARILTYNEAVDWDAYRAIGTPEECRVAMEKQAAKKPYLESVQKDEYREDECWECPTCDSFLGYEVDCRDDHYRENYCPCCGQELDWNDLE